MVKISGLDGDIRNARDKAAIPAMKAELEAAARATINPPKKPITTRLSVHDLSKLKVRAMQLGIPYQTLLASIVHQYVEGRLVEKN